MPFISLSGSEVLFVLRALNSVAACCLLVDSKVFAALFAAGAMAILQDNTLIVASFQELELWSSLTTGSVISIVVTQIMLFLSNRQIQQEHHNAYHTWFFAMVLEKGYAMFLLYMLREDLSKASDFDDDEFARKSSLIYKTSSLVRSMSQRFESAPPGNVRSNSNKSMSSNSNSDNKPPLGPRRMTSGLDLVEIIVRINRGRDLVAKDTNLFGKHTTSDPYVMIYLGTSHIGTTDIVRKTLNPVWPKLVFQRMVMAKTLEKTKALTCLVYDWDRMSKDDPMGTVMVPIPTVSNQRVSAWYKVGNGTGEHYCRNPSGEILVEIEIQPRHVR